MTKMTSMKAHFVLVHGAFHGGWCWYKIRTLLESAGHKVTCPDLRSAGIDNSDPNEIFTFEDYNEPLYRIMSDLDDGEKVILVGHSFGGQSVTAAMHKYPKKIQAAVYLVAVMFRHGFVKKIELRSQSREIYDTYHAEGSDRPPTSQILRKEFRKHRFYNRSPFEDSTLATMLLKPISVRAFTDVRFPDDAKEIDKVPRVYIKTLDDNAISEEGQDAIIKQWPPNEVYSIDSDHSAFFSQPLELFGLLLKVATKYG